MKSSNKSSIITGTVLLTLSALFSISLLLQLLDFGFGGPGHSSILFSLGNMLYLAYGFSSILIPLFIFIAGLSCFATKWTSKKTMRLITALIPFFTSVLTEKICRSILIIDSTSASTVKIVITLVTGAMLIIIEILGAGIIAESVNQKLFYKNGEPRKSTSYEDDSQKEEKQVTKTNNDEIKENKNEVVEKDEKDEKDFSFEPIKKNTAFDKSLSNIKLTTIEEIQNDDSYNSLVEDANNLYEENVPSIEEYENIDKNDDLEESIEPVESIDSIEEKQDEKSSQNTENIENNNKTSKKEIKISDEEKEAAFSLAIKPYELQEMKEKEAEKTEDDPVAEKTENNVQENTQEDTKSPLEEEKTEEIEEEKEPVNPATIITQEEYAALINPEADFSEEDDESDELEWPDLPPAPETLPPDYIDDEDDDDPALEFPPKDEIVEKGEEVARQAEAENLFEEAINAQKLSDNEETPYSSPKIIDSLVHPNPAYPFGITLHDEDEPVVAQKKTVRPETPKYPVKISLDENEEIEPIEPRKIDENKQNNVPTAPKQAPIVENYSPRASGIILSSPEPEDDEEEYQEDVTLPEPSFVNMADDNYSIQENDSSLDPDFFDIDMNSQEDDEELSDDIDEIPESEQTSNSVFKQIYAQETGRKGLSSLVSNVFSDMEEDIRKSAGFSENIQIEEKPSNISPEENNQLDDTSTNSPELNPNANSAKNLTADELTDFFNAQQAENTPVTHEIQGNLPKTNRAEKKGPYIIPSDLLTAYKDDQYWIIDAKTKEASINLKQTLAEFNIDAEIIGIKKGPVVTMFELLPAPGVKLSKIVALQDNIALSLAASSVRIVAPIPGKQAVGIEVPNKDRSIVSFREIIEMELPEYNKMAVPVILGKDILGKAQLIDLVKTPHMLIAGATGSGKSVCVNSLILSILYKRSYKDVKLILVDPKVVELKLYNNIPHLLTPVITEPKKALQALQYCLCEMERRYALLDGLGVRDISSYNQRIKERDICSEKLPYIVVIIDEFADLMATSGKELESIVARLTAMSRAVGIHLVLATQRPSVNVITGLIKANIPSRIAFMVASRTDSNIIIDSVGAEKLLGRGDMLYASAVDPYPIRIQGTFVSDSEVENVVDYVKQYGEPDYIDEEIFIEEDDDEAGTDLFGNSIGEDPLYDQALDVVIQAGKASASYIQRRLKIGYNRAARLVEEMEERGIVGPANGSKPREIIHIP